MPCEEVLVVPGVEELLVDDGLLGSSRLCSIDSKLSELLLLLDELCEPELELLWLDPWPP
jgi:hypothetical protein